jgi:hypothetical protein
MAQQSGGWVTADQINPYDPKQGWVSADQVTKAPEGPQMVGPKGERITMDEYKTRQSTPKEPTFMSQLFDVFGRYASRLGHNVVDLPMSMAQDIASRLRQGVPPQVAAGETLLKTGAEMGKGMLAAQGQEYVKAQQARQQGRYDQALMHLIAYATPVLGPMADDLITRTMSGQSPEVAADLTAMLVGQKVAEAFPKSVQVFKPKTPINPVVARAVTTAEKHGIPLNAGLATDIPAIRATQEGIEKTGLLSGWQAGKRNLERQEAFRDTLLGKAQSTGGTATTYETAGEAARGSVQREIAQQQATATRHYDQLRAMEANNQVIGVDMDSVRARLKPIADELARRKRVGGELGLTKAQREASINLDAFMSSTAPVAALTDVDAILSDLKALLRDSKKASQGAAISKDTAGLAKLVQELNQEVVSAAKSSAPGAYDALRQGRLATIAKWDANDVLATLREEPVGVIRQVLAQKDGGITLLKNLDRVSPNVMPEIARASLQTIIEEGMSGGTVSGAKMLSNWKNIGNSTRRIIFRDALKKNPQFLSELDDLFLMVDKASSSMNPPGTAAMGVNLFKAGIASSNPSVWPWLALNELGSAGMAKALSSPAVVKALRRGVRLPSGSSAANVAANVAALNTALKAAGVPPLSAPSTPPTRAVGAGQNTGNAPRYAVRDPDGQVHYFGTQQQAEAFRRQAGIR